MLPSYGFFWASYGWWCLRTGGGGVLTRDVERCHYCDVMANWRSVKNFKNWECVVLLHVHTLLGLYLVDPIDMEKSFNPSSQLKSYIDKIKKKEKDILDQCQKAMSLIPWT